VFLVRFVEFVANTVSLEVNQSVIRRSQTT